MPDTSLLTLALGAGLLAAVNPCGFALLPAYLSLLVLGDQPEDRTGALLRALRLTAAMTLGFAGVFAVFGLVVAPIAPQVQGQLPWVTLALGLLLAALGAYLVTGRTFRLPRVRRNRPAKALTGTFPSMMGFGAGYATASLTCTIAPFLAVVVSAFRTDSFGSGAMLFLAYAGGMGLVVGTVAVATALARDTVIRRLRSSGRWVPRVSGGLLLLAGSYVAYYGWWEMRVLAGGGTDDPVIGFAESLQVRLARGVDSLSPLTWLLILAALVAITLVARLLRTRRHRTSENAESAHQHADSTQI
ncbi:MAG: cytochrome c biogenesis protein CcdA [Nocardioides sp.]